MRRHVARAGVGRRIPMSLAWACRVALAGTLVMGTVTGARPVFAQTGTSTTVASSSNPSPPGQATTFTATVSPTPDGGTVAFSDAGGAISGCTAQPVSTSNGQATCTTTSLSAVGSHLINAQFSGTANFGTSASVPVLTQVVDESLAGDLTSGSGPDSASWDSSHVYTFIRGNDNALWYRAWNGSVWSGWQSLGGGMTADPGAVSWGPNRIDVFIRGNDNALWHIDFNGTGWSGWENLGGSLTSGPDAASWASGRLDIFVRGPGNGLYHMVGGSGGWSSWESLGGNLTSDPAAVSWGPNRIDIFARGADNALWQFAWTGSSWWGWGTLGGYLTSAPDAASSAPGLLDVAALGSGQGLWHLNWHGSSWSSWLSVGGQWTGNPSAVSPPQTATIDYFMPATGSAGAAARAADSTTSLWWTHVAQPVSQYPNGTFPYPCDETHDGETFVDEHGTVWECKHYGNPAEWEWVPDLPDEEWDAANVYSGSFIISDAVDAVPSGAGINSNSYMTVHNPDGSPHLLDSGWISQATQFFYWDGTDWLQAGQPPFTDSTSSAYAQAISTTLSSLPYGPGWYFFQSDAFAFDGTAWQGGYNGDQACFGCGSGATASRAFPQPTKAPPRPQPPSGRPPA